MPLLFVKSVRCHNTLLKLEPCLHDFYQKIPSTPLFLHPQPLFLSPVHLLIIPASLSVWSSWTSRYRYTLLSLVSEAEKAWSGGNMALEHWGERATRVAGGVRRVGDLLCLSHDADEFLRLLAPASVPTPPNSGERGAW